ncbi:hypothetical protein SprV_0100084900 [Sparganum proliferum]
MEYLQEISDILRDLKKVKEEFRLKMNGVEVFTQSNHHDGLQKLYARKRALRACLFSKTTTTNPVMTRCLDREMSGALDLLDEARAKYEQLEREWRAAVKLVSPLDPIKNFTAVVKGEWAPEGPVFALLPATVFG